ncbi:MAG: outer membrane beta-barrel protein [Gammaproteobacteria bacterium]|nr:outer membrane beta-barrel protein [Gammaproteobacteria bacterium]
MKLKKIHAQFILGLLGTCLALPALSAVSIPYGWYLGGNAGWSKIDNKSYPGSNNYTGVGGSVNLGYKFNPFVALEVDGTKYANVVTQVASITVARDSHYSYGVLGKVMCPFGASGASLFGKAGISRLQSNLKVTNQAVATQYGVTFNSGVHYATGLYLAAGGEYSFTPNLLANIELASAQGNSNTGNAELLTAGLAYLF